jgi:hypothetical protein
MKRFVVTVLWGFLVAALFGYAMFALGWVIAEPSSAPRALGASGFMMALAFLVYKAGRNLLS